jgi:hypothetical protein
MDSSKNGMDDVFTIIGFNVHKLDVPYVLFVILSKIDAPF